MKDPPASSRKVGEVTLLERITAKSLALVDVFFQQFATLTPGAGGTLGLSNCVSMNVDSVTLTTCGESLITFLGLLISVATECLYFLVFACLPGLLSR